MLPHRYPFLMVDRIEQIEGDESCVGIKNVTFNEPYFQGHFPGRPVMPGVLLLEGMAQTAGAICAVADGTRPAALASISSPSTRRSSASRSCPATGSNIHMTKLNQRKTMWWYRGEAKVDGKMVCEAEVGAMMADSDDGGMARIHPLAASIAARPSPMMPRSAPFASSARTSRSRAAAGSLSHVHVDRTHDARCPHVVYPHASLGDVRRNRSAIAAARRGL